MPIIKASGEATIYIYDVPPNFKEDLDCILESPRKGGGPINDLVFMDEIGAAEVTFEESRGWQISSCSLICYLIFQHVLWLNVVNVFSG